MKKGRSTTRAAFPYSRMVRRVPFRSAPTGHTIHQMDRQQIQRFKTRLEIRQHELRATIEHQLKNARMVEPEPDAVDQANSALEKESLLQRGREEQWLLRAVESALGRIREGSFGQCLSCGNEIGRARLEAVPWTPYCIDCQEAFER